MVRSLFTAQGIDHTVPTEVWVQVFQYLYPSQLSRLSMVSTSFYSIVSGLSQWIHWFNKTYGHLKFWINPLSSQPSSRGCHPRVYMQHLCAESMHICEQCLTANDQMRRPRAPMASMPLRISGRLVVAAGVLDIRKYDDHQRRVGVASSHDDDEGHDWNREREVLEVRKRYRKLDDNVKKEDWTLLLCLWCRCRVFEIFPEPVPPGVAGNYLTKKQLMAKYPIGRKMVKNIDDRLSQGQYSELEALKKLRMLLGGDIGIDAWHMPTRELKSPNLRHILAMVVSLPTLKRETQVLQVCRDKETR
ncbi:hypothetical protein BGZ98_006360 [Dissophora globulifera]|nr:hypothetical protein BGZ98_006360 [Dissophora globulifera]